MKIVYQPKLSDVDNQTVLNISASCGITKDTAKLLFYRKIDTVEKAKRFLNPSKNYLHSPMLLSGMKEAVSEIVEARLKSKNVLIFGDYDVDGISASAILKFALEEFGIDALVAIPEREDGYGINLDIIDRICLDTPIDLIITVDCGIGDFDKIEILKSKGISVIVTDHHEPPEILPECIRINPKLKGQDYPFSGLCGAGVAYKLAYALIGDSANKYLDFVALATVADSMELIDENRDLVFEGLKLFNNGKVRMQFSHLLGKIEKTITSQTLSFTLAPRINAGGRMGDANTSLKLFLSKDNNECFDLSVKLNEYNILRQEECDNIYNQAKSKIIEENLVKDEIILVADDNWGAGFLGIVSARLVEEFGRPAIVFSSVGDNFKGSARSIDEISIYECLNAVSDVLETFGGHAQAAGATVNKGRFSELRERLNSYIKDNYKNIDTEKKIYAEWEVNSKFSIDFAREINALEPFGLGNKKPQFTCKVYDVISNPLKIGSTHYSFTTPVIDMLNFNGLNNVSLLKMPVKKHVVFELNLSTFNKKESLKGFVKTVVADYTDPELIKEYAYLGLLNNVYKEPGEYKGIKYLDRENYILSGGYGTIYAINDLENLKLYPELKNLPIGYLEPSIKTMANCIVISLDNLPNGYDRVIYLDKPIVVPNFNAEIIVVEDVLGYKSIDGVSLDRTAFSDVFIDLASLSKHAANNEVEIYFNSNSEIEYNQYIFSLKVFLELGFFKIENGILLQDKGKKSPLTNSYLYSKINMIKG